MAWTDPRTWNVGEIVTKAIMDAHVKMNLRYLHGDDGTVTLSDGLNLGANELTINSLETVGADGIVNKEQMEDHTHQDAANCGTLDHGLALTGLADDDHTQYVLRNILTTRGDIVYRDALDWARLEKGAEGYYLRQGANDPYWAAGTTVGNYGAGDNLLHASAGVSGTNSTDYVKAKEVYVPGSGTLRIKFDLTPAAVAAVYGRIYRNGVAVGTERSVAGGGGETNFSEDIAGWTSGDFLQIYIKRGAEADETVNTNDLNIYTDDGGYDFITTQAAI